MGTKGFLGIRNNEKLLLGKFNSLDSYYDYLGKNVIDYYFDDKGYRIFDLSTNVDDDIEFLQDGFFCRYAFVYNEDNDTLEVYRGFFTKKQILKINKREVLNSLEEPKKQYEHLIMIIDKKKHTKKQVIKAFDKYTNEKNEDGVEGYPERKIIPLEIPKNYVHLV